jgi:hypothetical protein
MNDLPLYAAMVSLNGETGLTNSVGLVNFYDLKTDTSLVYQVEYLEAMLFEDTLILKTDSILNLNYINTRTGNITGAAGIRLYPVPAGNRIRLSGLPGPVPYRIRDIRGRVMAKGKIREEQDLDISELEDGIYFFEIPGQNTLKFIVNRNFRSLF